MNQSDRHYQQSPSDGIVKAKFIKANKKRYTAPALVEWGSITDVTQGAVNATPEPGGGRSGAF